MKKVSTNGYGFIEIEGNVVNFNSFNLHDKHFTDTIKEVVVTDFQKYVETKYILENGAANLKAVAIIKYPNGAEVFRKYEKVGNNVALFNLFQIV